MFVHTRTHSGNHTFSHAFLFYPHSYATHRTCLNWSQIAWACIFFRSKVCLFYNHAQFRSRFFSLSLFFYPLPFLAMFFHLFSFFLFPPFFLSLPPISIFICYALSAVSARELLQSLVCTQRRQHSKAGLVATHVIHFKSRYCCRWGGYYFLYQTKPCCMHTPYHLHWITYYYWPHICVNSKQLNWAWKVPSWFCCFVFFFLFSFFFR